MKTTYWSAQIGKWVNSRTGAPTTGPRTGGIDQALWNETIYEQFNSELVVTQPNEKTVLINPHGALYRLLENIHSYKFGFTRNELIYQFDPDMSHTEVELGGVRMKVFDL